jgi:hypothetical protein
MESGWRKLPVAGPYRTVEWDLARVVAALTLLLLSGVIPWWAALPGVVLGLWFQLVPLVTTSEKSFLDPAVLRVPWHNHYSSHDPIPNGPIEVVAPVSSVAATLDTLLAEQITSAVSDFNERQREVTNYRSTLWDHTSYWSSQDDFVAGVVEILTKASGIPIHLTLDEEWLKVSTARRLWRVRWLSRCRMVAGLAALAIFFWPRDVLYPASSYGRKVMAAAVAKVPEQFVAWLPNASGAPDWLMGGGDSHWSRGWYSAWLLLVGVYGIDALFREWYPRRSSPGIRWCVVR